MDTKQAVIELDKQPTTQALQRIEPELPQTTSSAMLAVVSRAAADPSVDVGKMQQLLKIQMELLAYEAEQESNSAMTLCQAEIPYIRKNARNPQTSSEYSKRDYMNAIIKPIIAKHGFSLSYGTADCPIPDSVRVTCEVRHSGQHGTHTKHYQCDMPLDILGMKGNPSKTKTHGYASALEYGQRYLLKMIFNIADGTDDDGNKAGGSVEGPEVIIGLKSILWQMLKDGGNVAKGQTWVDARQFLVDEDCIPDDVPIQELNAEGFRSAIAKVKAKLQPQ